MCRFAANLLYGDIPFLEERRIREEEEEREREERERVEREEAARRQEQQDARIADETAKVAALEAEWNQQLQTWKNEQAKQKEVIEIS